VVKRGEVEALSQYEDRGDVVATVSDERLVMAARAGVGIWIGDAVEVAREDARIRWIGQGSAGAFGLWTLCAFLDCPFGGEEFFAEGDELRNGELVFFAVLYVPRNGYFAANPQPLALRPCSYCNQANEDRHE